jgi:hypothetical protein
MYGRGICTYISVVIVISKHTTRVNVDSRHGCAVEMSRRDHNVREEKNKMFTSDIVPRNKKR